ncbi:uncharacterized protein FIBRA_08963 [Fibroporia radiculosa]|uniref:Uncharacterized protein n=1 Tax=Fibroporia radiculosa TaxID=599839 RepID=J4GIL6_9APHY|nr:uncharacterized protein FIBRA_08963 [Fibroporia radiculosa]CCM06678.1 predicted protein [Fibroporia radiculosa]
MAMTVLFVAAYELADSTCIQHHGDYPNGNTRLLWLYGKIFVRSLVMEVTQTWRKQLALSGITGQGDAKGKLASLMYAKAWS